MKSIDFYIYYFTHKINLKEYFEKVYSMSFNQVNNLFQSSTDPNFYVDPQKNTWMRKNIPKDQKSPKGVFLGTGNLLDWEAIKNDIAISETSPIILKNIKGLLSYDSDDFKRIQKLYRLINTRLKHNSDTDVEVYLNNRGIDIQLIKNDFNLGILSNYDRLYNKMPSNERNNLRGVFISQKKIARHLKPGKGFSVPIKYNSLQQVGYHGRYIADIKKPYFNSGYVKDIVGEILFGEDNPKIQTAINSKKQLLLCKGIIDLFSVYQNGAQQVFSTLSKSISIEQFNKIKIYDVDEIIIGYHVHRYQARFAALMQLDKISIPIKHTAKFGDLDQQLLDPSISANTIIKQALEKYDIDQKSMRNAKISKRNYNLGIIREYNGTFLIRCKDIETKIIKKITTRQLKDFIVQQAKTNIKLLPKNNFYVEFPRYKSAAILNFFGAEIRTLLYLLIKSVKTGKVGYGNEQLAYELGIGLSTLREHKKKLIEMRYLIIEDKYVGKGKTRKVHTDFYPSTLPYGSIDNEKQ